MLKVERNAILVGNRGGVQLCTWWGQSTFAANVFWAIGGDISAGINCDGNPLFAPAGNLHLDATADGLHDPQPSSVDAYIEVFNRVCAPAVPAAPNLVEMSAPRRFLKELAAQVAALGGKQLSCMGMASDAVEVAAA